MYSELTECIICAGAVKEVLNLGTQYVVDFVKEKNTQLLKAPLVLMLCESCSLVQLKHIVSSDRLYKKFWYRSGINPQMKDELLAIVQKAGGRTEQDSAAVELKPGDRVLDIGCNDGTLLGWYDKRVVTVGIDPCKELVEQGVKEKRIDIGLYDYFSLSAIDKITKMVGLKERTKFKIITSVAMFYDVPNPVSFLIDCAAILDKRGVLIIQMNSLTQMIRDSAFDFICHEHLALYSITALKIAVEKAGLYLAGLELSASNGGSIRAYITHRGFDDFYKTDFRQKLWLGTNLDMKLMEEMKLGLDKKEVYELFLNRVANTLAKLKKTIDKLVDDGKKIYAYGASTRGTVLMQCLYPEGTVCPIKGVAEKDSSKFGLKMVGTWLPIMPEEQVRQDADYMLCLPWHFKDSIIKREKDFIARGGKLIFPLPKPHIAQNFAEGNHSEVLIDTGASL